MFKVGDRVRVVGGVRIYGETGTVDAVGGHAVYVELDNGEVHALAAVHLEAVETPRHRVYVWGSENAAEVFRMTVDAILGYSPERTGSALVMAPSDYAEICEKTYAVHAAIVAKVLA